MLEFHEPTITGIVNKVLGHEVLPSSILFSPVFSSFDQDQSVVGSIALYFKWNDIFKFVLPRYIKGIFVVLKENAEYHTDMGQTYTYKVDGDDVNLVGEGDFHEFEFDKYEKIVVTKRAQDAAFRGILDNLITYTIFIYPSREFEQQFYSSTPVIMIIVIVVVLIFTSTVFVLYDYLVHNRQNSMMKYARRSGGIVNSMFPSSVHERLFSSRERTSDKEINKLSSVERIRLFLLGGLLSPRNQDLHTPESLNYTMNETPPIANLFHETTVMFADIVCFTEWSAAHSPEDVFCLLETLFFEFDETAEKMGVFKVGTIGDCYVAVTGVPDSRVDHSEVMAKFANECRHLANQVFLKLDHKIDASVSRLSVRIGLHSGPVTAGVLRGLKPRFDLFGDTINTASRMESTGIPNRIQVSEQTAECLKERGLASWLQPRLDMVFAKGKGYLKTFWLEISDDIHLGTNETRS